MNKSYQYHVTMSQMYLRFALQASTEADQYPEGSMYQNYHLTRARNHFLAGSRHHKDAQRIAQGR